MSRSRFSEYMHGESNWTVGRLMGAFLLAGGVIIGATAVHQDKVEQSSPELSALRDEACKSLGNCRPIEHVVDAGLLVLSGAALLLFAKREP